MAHTNLQRPALPQSESCTVVIFGASGDLAKRKLIPALFNLACEDVIKDGGRFRVVGVGRTQISDDDFRKDMHEWTSKSKDTRQYSEENWTKYAEQLSYFVGDPKSAQMFDELKKYLEELPNASKNYIFYLSTPPSVYADYIEGLGKAGLGDESAGFRRVVIEKPFGHDLESAKDLNRKVGDILKEEQVYRIDHYLGKETVQNILVFRFANSLFEPVWNRNYIDFVEITAAEPLGTGGRAAYYEEAGALRDMVTNHLMQLLMLVAMEPPVAFSADDVREEKVQVLRSIRRLSPEQIEQRTVRAQYLAGEADGEQTPAYRSEEGVKPDSETETFALVQFNVDNWRWAGVPFYIRTGKRLAKQLTEVRVHFKRVPTALFARQADDILEPNIITLRIQPDEGINISFGAKVPGAVMQTGNVEMDFGYKSGFGVKSPAAYETLLLDVMIGDATLFTRRDEVEAEWRLITPIAESWAQKKPALQFYDGGSNGPTTAAELLSKNGHAWHDLSE